jgi:hypothetical protein
MMSIYDLIATMYLVGSLPPGTAISVMSSPMKELANVAPEYMIPIQKESLIGYVYLHPHSMFIGMHGMMKNPMN